MNQAPDTPRFDPSLPHHQRPWLRPVRGFPARVQDRTLLGISDSRQISDKMVLAPMEARTLLPLLDGERTVEQICEQFGQGLGVEQLQSFVSQLDHAGLLFGPVFDAMLASVRADFDASDTLPPAATAAVTEIFVADRLGPGATEEQQRQEAPVALRAAFDGWINEVLSKEQKELDRLPRAIMVPHVDYPRGSVAYAAVWGRLRGLPRPDRVVILGTNHFGAGTGVTVCDKGYETALGVCPLDARLLEALRKRLGADASARALEHKYDHEREHSIELQIPWIQHCLGADGAGGHLPVLGVLIHDPTVNQGDSYDGKGLGMEPFVEALTGALEDVGGRTLIVSSADLSHAGPTFGDEIPLTGDSAQSTQARDRVVAHDQDMLKFIGEGKPDELLAAMYWQQNPTRWCSIGNIVATLKVAKPTEVSILRYAAALDPAGMTMVTCAGAVMF